MARWNLRRQRPRRVDRLRPEGDVSWYERLKGRRARWQVGILLLFIAAALLIVQLPRPPLAYRKGETTTHPILSRVDFEYIDYDVTANVRELTALLRVPGLYSPNAKPAIDLRESLLSLVDDIAKAGALDGVPQEIRTEWNVDGPMFAAVKKALGDEAANLPALRQAVTDATTLLADPLRLPVILQEDYERAAARIGRFRDLRKQLPAGLSPEVAPILEEPASLIVIQLPEGDQELPLNSTILIPRTAEIKARIRLLIGPALEPIFGADGVERLAVSMAPKVGPTLVFDQAKTENRRAEVKSRVQPVPILRKQGTTLVEAGKEITDADLKILLQEQEAYLAHLGWPRKVLAWLGALAVIVALVLAEAGYATQVQPRIARSIPRSLMLALLAILVLGLAKLAAQSDGFSVGPMALATFLVTTAGMIVTIAYEQTFALAVVWTLALLVAVAARAEFDWALVAIAGNTVAVLSLRSITNRSKLIKVGALTGLVFFTTHAGLALWRVAYPGLATLPQTVLWPALLAFCAGLAAGTVMLALLPFIERVFGIVTDISLLELCDVNQPALKRLALEAPGTYAHSLLTGTLSEAAAEAIGASGLLARVGAYFHDIGKANKPRYFIENYQGDEQPHETLTPAMSRLIIASHVKDGQEIADRLGLPPIIRDFIAEHHGTTLMEYFYHEACKQAERAGEEPPDENEYRYPGPKPQRPETAIVMIADAVEGATRSLKDRTASRIKATVHDMVMKRLLDGQLDESGLTMNDLQKVEEALTKTLLSVYHGRIAYPGQREVQEASKGTGGEEPGASADESPSTKQSADDVTADARPRPSAAPSDNSP